MAVLQAELSCVCAALPHASFLLATLAIHAASLADEQAPTAPGMALTQL
jgi:hypothetical protein